MKQVTNKMFMKLESRSINESFSRQTVAAFVAQLDPTMEEINDIKTIVSEAVTNSVVHGYRDKLGIITISVKLLEGNIAEIKVKDNGCGIEDIEQARQPMFTTGDEQRSGMGFTIMESFTDKLKVQSRIGKGTQVTLIKKIKGREGK